ncbi:hypothetical protein KUCAC02_002870 [Chaenocephalus aceratus]|uniref:Uncharacterized protein n=1 Tax=Chaenocephalus aceratus TaxID=36190 RepID=A0ACB9WJ99_CHAAC|nr:hypothetical protein KUCAC02_002870 [Chaenocephalus aceratus]
MVSNPHLSAALTCVAIRRLLAGAMARSNRRRRRLRRILAMCQWQVLPFLGGLFVRHMLPKVQFLND